jgi:hypothetical protein
MGAPGKIENLKPWKPGQSGNPGGRPKKRPITQRYAQFAEVPVEAKTRKALKLPKGATLADAAVKRAYQEAINGNLDALEEIREAIEGKVSNRWSASAFRYPSSLRRLRTAARFPHGSKAR